MKKITLPLLTGLLILLFTGCQTIAEPSEMMEMNRQGQWENVRESGLVHLRNLEELDNVQICDAYYNLIYSEVRLGMIHSAEKHLVEFELILENMTLPDTHRWLESELEKIKDELGV